MTLGAEAHSCQRLREHAVQLRDWMLDTSLPLWAANGFHESGGAWEALDFNGVPIRDGESRVRVQARQLYCFALAHRLGWQPERSSRIVVRLLQFIENACRRADGLYGRRVDLHAGRLVDDTPDLYDNAFILLALASARAVLGEVKIDRRIDALLAALDAVLGRGDENGYDESASNGIRLQNPHMHLFESLLACYAVSRRLSVRHRLQRLYRFIQRQFFDEQAGIVRECTVTEGAGCAGFQPGHSMEWVWLLSRRSRALDEPWTPFADALYQRALTARDRSGRVPMVVAGSGEAFDASCRLWAQAEVLKAHLVVSEFRREPSAGAALECAIACCEDIQSFWLCDVIAGGWRDHFTASAQLVSTDMPAGNGYHLYGAIAELIRYTQLAR